MSAAQAAQVKREEPTQMKLEDILQSDVWNVDEEPHIVIDYTKCEKCEAKPCVYLCPAGCYTLVGNKVVFSYEWCVECGTCRVICPMDAIKWDYPKSGHGIIYRFT